MSLRSSDDIITPSLIIVSCDPFEMMILQMGVSCDAVDTTRIKERTGMRYSSLAERRKEMAERDKGAIGVLDIRRGRREKEVRERGERKRRERKRRERKRRDRKRRERKRRSKRERFRSRRIFERPETGKREKRGY